VTILHSSENKLVFVTQAIIPAFFQPNDIESEIQRLSCGFGQAQVLVADPRPGVPHAVLAAWGAVTLTPLDEDAMGALRRGEQIHRGLVAEFIGDTHRSARLGLPVYSIGGGPGYLWGASFDDTGKGSLRLSAVDATALGSPQSPAPISPSPALSYNSPPPPAAAPTAPSADELVSRERARAERAEKIVRAANKQLDYVTRFIQEHAKNPKLRRSLALLLAQTATRW
jgi:hypothetical protein